MFKIKECHQNSEYLIAVDQAAGAHYKCITISIVWECLREPLKLFLAGKKSYTAEGAMSEGIHLEAWRLDRAAKSLAA